MPDASDATAKPPGESPRTASPSRAAVDSPPPQVGTPRPPAPAPSTSIDGRALADAALALKGAPYRAGGSDPQGFDCSGFTQYVFSRVGVALPRAVHDQFELGKSVKPGDLTFGDLLFFSTTARGASHVGIVVGADQFIHAPSSTGVVRVEHLSARYWSRRYVGARRIN